MDKIYELILFGLYDNIFSKSSPTGLNSGTGVVIVKVFTAKGVAVVVHDRK